ncbi:DUF2029 domain-containing protein [bacterium]|nr:DUF2029 domain-containing protein [bacterium]
MTSAKEEPTQATRWLIIAIVGWVGLSLFISGAVLLSKKHRSVITNYNLGAERWIEGAPLYDGTGEGFIYLPQSAILYTPWALLSETWREITFRWTGVAVYMIGLYAMCQLLFPNHSLVAFGRASLCAVPMSYCAMRNGQATMLFTGVFLLSTTMLGRQQWAKSAALMILGFAVKPFMIVPILLSAATQSRMRLKLLFGMLVFALIPFLAQRWDYVMSQYPAAFAMLRDVDRLGHNTQLWCQVFGLLHQLGLGLGEQGQRMVQLVAAIGTLGLCFWCTRLPRARQAFYLFSLTATYLMLFNARNEMNTYALLGPAVGFVAVQAYLERNNVLWWQMAAVAIGATANYELGKLIIPGIEQIWMITLAGILFAYCLIKLLIKEVRSVETLPNVTTESSFSAVNAA